MFIVAMLFVISQVSAQDCSQLTGTWMNLDSSVLHIETVEESRFIGAYQSNASDDVTLWATQGVVNNETEMTTISWMVNWGEYGSITSWTGYCKEEDGVPTITTQWYLVRPYVKYDWERFVTNQSIFTPYNR